MGHKHTREQILDAALEVALEVGLHQLSFGRVGRRLDISDRTVVYYFPTKNDLVTEVLMAMGLQLQATLAEAYETTCSDHLELARTAWPVVSSETSRATFGLFFEANGLAVAGQTPYADVVPALVEGWISWAAGFVDGPPDRQRTEAETCIALIDGLLLLLLVGGPEAADRAASALGVR